MPDVDIVHDKVAPKFRQAYRQLCEGMLSAEELSESIAKGLRNTLKKDANSAVEFIFQTLTQAFEEFDGDQPDLGRALGRFVDNCANKYVTNPRYTALAVDALKACLTHLENLQFINHSAKAAISDFAVRVLNADFRESMNLLSHHADATCEEIHERMQSIEPYLRQEVEYIVNQILRYESAASLRKRRKKRGPEPDFSEEDISSSIV